MLAVTAKVSNGSQREDTTSPPRLVSAQVVKSVHDSKVDGGIRFFVPSVQHCSRVHGHVIPYQERNEKQIVKHELSIFQSIP